MNCGGLTSHMNGCKGDPETVTISRDTYELYKEAAEDSRLADWLLENLRKARTKHPWPTDDDERVVLYKMLAALSEEVGELAKEVLEDGGDRRIYEEAGDVATVAIRIMERW